MAPDLYAYFTPGTGLHHASVLAQTATFSQTEAPGVNYYCLLRGVNDVNALSGNANRTGKFILDLTPESATPWPFG